MSSWSSSPSRRDRIFSYVPYVALFRDEPPAAEADELQETEADVG